MSHGTGNVVSHLNHLKRDKPSSFSGEEQVHSNSKLPANLNSWRERRAVSGNWRRRSFLHADRPIWCCCCCFPSLLMQEADEIMFFPPKKNRWRGLASFSIDSHTAGISSLIRHHFLNEKEVERGRDGFAAGYFHISTDPSIKFPWKLFVGPETKTKRQAPVPFRVAEWTAQ